jgi:hypothetical protein
MYINHLRAQSLFHGWCHSHYRKITPCPGQLRLLVLGRLSHESLEDAQPFWCANGCFYPSILASQFCIMIIMHIYIYIILFMDSLNTCCIILPHIFWCVLHISLSDIHQRCTYINSTTTLFGVAFHQVLAECIRKHCEDLQVDLRPTRSTRIAAFWFASLTWMSWITWFEKTMGQVYI